jgi:hypothetical protein
MDRTTVVSFGMQTRVTFEKAVKPCETEPR